MRAYHLDLRERVVAAVDDGTPIATVAARFRLHRSTIYRYLAQRQESGTLVPRTSPGRTRAITRADDGRLVAQLQQHPTATLSEHCAVWKQATGVWLSPATLSRAIRRVGVDQKKRTVAASERDAAKRAAWWDETLTLPVAHLVFLDETGTNTAMTPHYGWAPSGARAAGSAPRNHGPNVTLVTTLSLAGLGPPMVIDGPMTTLAFDAYVAQVLVPTLRPGQIVVLDNLSAHTSQRTRTLIEAAGCSLRFLPPYSPDFSPIEWAFSKLKTWLRRTAARTNAALDAAIAAGLDQITRADAHGWFRGCGYDVQSQPL